MTDLRQAAQAVVERWDTPLWKDVPHTAEYIEALRTALAEPQECGWMKTSNKGTTISCRTDQFWFLSDRTDLKFCMNCGKKIKFVEGE